MTKKFASVADLEVKKTTFAQLSEHCWAYTAEGDPNTGVIIGEDSVLICDALATPVMAQSLIAEIRKVTDKPIKYVVLSHYHAVRVLGASGYKNAGMQEIIASQGTYEMIVERGEQDWKSEYERFPRLFDAYDSIPGLTWPTLVFKDEMTLWMGKLEVKIMHLGPGHTKGDTIVWVPAEKCCSPAIWSKPMLPATPATPSLKSGRQRWMHWLPSVLKNWCPVVARRSTARRGCRPGWLIPAISSAPCSTRPRKPSPKG